MNEANFHAHHLKLTICSFVRSWQQVYVGSLICQARHGDFLHCSLVWPLVGLVFSVSILRSILFQSNFGSKYTNSAHITWASSCVPCLLQYNVYVESIHSTGPHEISSAPKAIPSSHTGHEMLTPKAPCSKLLESVHRVACMATQYILQNRKPPSRHRNEIIRAMKRDLNEI